MRKALTAAAAIVCAAFAAPAFAQENAATYPSKPVRAITALSAGGTSDVFMRVVGAALLHEFLHIVAIDFVEHPQGGTKKGQPNEAMKEAAKADGRTAEGLWMPGSLRLLEDAIYEKRIRFRRNPVLISAMMSAVTDEDRWDNRWLSKERAVNKIDAAVAVCMAIGAAEAMRSSMPTGERFQMIVV